MENHVLPLITTTLSLLNSKGIAHVEIDDMKKCSKLNCAHSNIAHTFKTKKGIVSTGCNYAGCSCKGFEEASK